MHIAIFTSGNVNNGIWSSVNGEGRWGLNLAQVLIAEDQSIHIDLIGDNAPQWGIQPAHPRINTRNIQSAQYEKYDVAIYVPWEAKLNQQWTTCTSSSSGIIKADLYIHNQFSWTTGLLNYTCFNQNHILVYPFKESLQTFPSYDHSSKTFDYEFLPYPYGWEILPPDSKRNEIVWPSKEVFHPAFETRSIHIPKLGIEMLETLSEISQQRKISQVHLLSGHSFDPSWTPLVSKLEIIKKIQNIPNTKIYNWLTYNEIFNIFKNCRVSVPVAGLAASLTEAVCLGVVPLVYIGTPLSAIAAQKGVLLNPNNCSKKEVYELIDLYMRDDSTYINTVLEYQDYMKDHSSKNVYNQFKYIVQKYKKA